MIGLLMKVDKKLAQQVADGLGLDVQPVEGLLNCNFGADVDPKDFQDQPGKSPIKTSPALTMADIIVSVKTRQIAVLAADGVDGHSIKE